MNKIDIMTTQCVEPDSALRLFISQRGQKGDRMLCKKAEFTDILFNIMSERRAKRGYKRRKGIAAFRDGYEQHGRHDGVKRDGKKNEKRC